ncbi:RICIN domain-containing protein [Kutzneria sp. NPDC051319]|uniref:RICIN domain-containing protein n=1 Tax=Kutzneria sp. NPDC051319 TaxID=3155047 RepID=UPI003438F56B
MSRSNLVGRRMRGFAVLAISATIAAGLAAGPMTAPTASAATSVAPESSNAAKVSAGREIQGFSVTPDKLALSDKNFVIALWSAAAEGTHIKADALKAFTDTVDELACKRFIEIDIHSAAQLDAIELGQKAVRDHQRLDAAREILWTDVPQSMLDVSLQNFVFALWQHAAEGSDVKKGAAAVLSTNSTDDQRTRFIVTDIYIASNADRQRAIEQQDTEERERAAKEANIKAKASAWAAATQATATDDVKNLPDHEFIWELIKRATGAQVKTAAQTAYDSRDTAVWHDFIVNGVHAAHRADIDEQDRLDAIAAKKKVQVILDQAVADGYLPNLAAAARTALAGTVLEWHAFLNTGAHEAAKLDLMKPADHRVIELQASRSGRCLQVAGLWENPGDAAHGDGAVTELWDCLRGVKQVWELVRAADDTYSLVNLMSKKCMDVNGDNIVQNTCNGAGTQWWRFVENTDGSFQIQNVGTGKYATVADNGTANASLVVQYTNTNSIDQNWRIIDPSHHEGLLDLTPGTINLKGVHSGRCLQVAGLWENPDEGANQDLAGMEIWDCVPSAKEVWTVIPLGDHKFSLKNQQSGKCLDVLHGDTANDTPLVQFTCHSGGSQQFVFPQGDNGSFGIQSVLTGKYADAFNDGTGNGTVVHMWGVNNLPNQRWTAVQLTTA